MGPFLNRRHFNALAVCTAVAGLSLPQTAWSKSAHPTILVLGDSLSAEYGLKRGRGWVALMEQRLATEKTAAKVINASISGDTTSGGRSRLPALLKAHQPTAVIIELGGNDALRGLPLENSQDNLLAMVRAAQATNAKVLLLGMEMPPNYGRAYAARFATIYTTVAKQTHALLVPFMLKGVADGPDPTRFFQKDRIHPTEAAHPIILDTVWPSVKKLIT